MEIVFSIIGAIFALAVSCALFCAVFEKIVFLWKSKKDSHFKFRILQNLSGISRWCGYEFPEMEFMADELIESINMDWCTINESQFRDKARAKFNKERP